MPCKVEQDSEEMELQSPSVVDLIWIVFTLAELWDLEESRGTSFILPMSLQKIALSFFVPSGQENAYW